VENIKTELEEKKSDIQTHQEQKKEAKDELTELITNCETLYNEYDVVRIQVRLSPTVFFLWLTQQILINQLTQQVLEMKNNRKNDSFSTSAWPTETKSAWSVEEPRAPEPVADDQEAAPEGYLRYRAVYEFYARNQDEITFQPGDIVMVSFVGAFNGSLLIVWVCRFR
jgi:intersectin